jgi:hypothetical protein
MRARQETGPLHRWIIWADDAEVERLRQFRQRSISEETRRRWMGITGNAEEATSAGRPRQITLEGDESWQTTAQV